MLRHPASISCDGDSTSNHEKRHDRKKPEHRDVDGSRHGVPVREVLTNREAPQPEHDPRISAASNKPSATKPTPSRAADVGGRECRRASHHAARIVTTNMMGASISLAILVPKLGATQSTRMVPRRKPAPNTRAK